MKKMFNLKGFLIAWGLLILILYLSFYDLKNYPILLCIKGFINGVLIAYFGLWTIFYSKERKDIIKGKNRIE